MIFSDEIKWDIYDFIIMGALLLTLGITINYILTKNFRLKIIYIITAIFLFIMVWFELAVGIFNLDLFSFPLIDGFLNSNQLYLLLFQSLFLLCFIRGVS
tara:strand:- start:1023 stop:1322 length:300 start_codon:yes stop_codon:yes gene_type:complete